MPSPIPSERAELGPAGRGRWWGAGLAPGPCGQEESIRWGSGGDAGESAESVSFTVVRGGLRPPAEQQQLEVKASGSETRPPCGHPPPCRARLAPHLLPSSPLPGGPWASKGLWRLRVFGARGCFNNIQAAKSTLFSSRTGASQGFPRAAAPVGVFSRGYFPNPVFSSVFLNSVYL